MASRDVYSEWRKLPGTAKRYRNIVSGEEISYRQARARGIAQAVKEKKIPIRYPGKSEKKPYRERGKWVKGLWQLEGRYVFENEDGTIAQEIGWSRNYKVKDKEQQRQEAINWAMAQLEGSGWEFVTIVWERWLRR